MESISSINCESRNNYNKEFCTGLNPDKINNFLKPYKDYPLKYVNKNIFSLEDEKKKIFDLDKKKCIPYAIDNKYAGLTYNGDKNKCMLFNSHDFNKTDDSLKNYKIKTFLKTKDTIDIKNIEDQTDSSKYFTEINNENKSSTSNNVIDTINVSNQNECIDSCIRDYNNCKSVIYMEQPKVCTFYNNKKMKNNKNINNYDTYTFKNINKDIINNLLKDSNNLDEDYYYCKLSNDQCFDDYSTTEFEKDNKIAEKIYNPDISIYNCSGLDSTNPFCTKEYNENDYKKNEFVNYTNCENTNEEDQNDILDNSCRKKYGEEYVFDNDIYNTKSVLKCDGGKRGKCKLNFGSQIIEHYDNKNNTFHIIIAIITIIAIISIIAIILKK